MPQDSTELDEIIVKGQRRQAETMDPFPEPPIITPVFPGDVAVIEPEPDLHPCDDPEKREEWNSDAAAAEALAEILRLSLVLDGATDLYTREWDAPLYRDATGRYSFNPVRHGDPMSGTIDMDFDSGGPHSELIGYIHSHPSAGGVSPADWDLLSYIDSQWSSHPSFRLRFYTIQPTYPPAATYRSGSFTSMDNPSASEQPSGLK